MKIAIVGKASTSRGLAPYGDHDWEIWLIHDMYKEKDRWTRFFEIHDLDFVKQHRPEDYVWLMDHQREVYIRDPHQDFPNANLFPWRELVERFGNYFTNTISWQIAYAIQLGATTIGIYGVDMSCDAATNGEYQHQRPSCEYFIGLARGMGIEVIVPKECDLLKTHRLYAVEAPTALESKMDRRVVEITKRVQHYQQEEQEAHDNAVYMRGVLDNTNYIRSRFYMEGSGR